VLSGEATNTNLLIFGLTPPALEPTIYCTRGEHVNHYVTDAVKRESQEPTPHIPDLKYNTLMIEVNIWTRTLLLKG
jgi:hypothetical protein